MFVLGEDDALRHGLDHERGGVSLAGRVDGRAFRHAAALFLLGEQRKCNEKECKYDSFHGTALRQASYRRRSRRTRAFGFLRRPRRARDGADDGPVALVHDDRLLRFRPEIDRDVVVTVAEDARLDREITHALTEALLAANRAPLHQDAGALSDTVEDADLRTQRIH